MNGTRVLATLCVAMVAAGWTPDRKKGLTGESRVVSEPLFAADVAGGA